MPLKTARKKQPPKPKSDQPLCIWDQDTLQLSQQVGEFIEYWGFKKVHGQIWTLIFLSKNPVDSTSLVKALQVSKALVSLAIKDLLHYEVIELAGKGKKRTTFFRSTSDLQGVIVKVLQNREKLLLSKTKQSLLKIEKKSKDKSSFCEERFFELKDMVDAADDFLEILINTRLEMSNL